LVVAIQPWGLEFGLAATERGKSAASGDLAGD
jgi:hypothetical protein